MNCRQNDILSANRVVTPIIQHWKEIIPQGNKGVKLMIAGDKMI